MLLTREQLQERLIGLQLRVILNYQEQSRQGCVHLRGRFYLIIQRGCARPLRTRFRNVFKNGLFMRRITFYRIDEIRYKIIAPLQLVFHLRPLRSDRFIPGNDAVIDRDARSHD